MKQQKKKENSPTRKDSIVTLPPRRSISSTKADVQKPSRKDELLELCLKCYKTIKHSINIVQACIIRVLFSVHSFVAICIAYSINQELWSFVNVVGIVFMGIELFITIIRRKGKEPKWFFPCFFVYICTMIPPIWLIELHRIEASRKARLTNSTGTLSFDVLGNSLEDLGIDSNDIIKNVTSVPIDLTPDNAAVYLEISLMLFIILGRWFLPKGKISRSSLSQLLLVYMSLASDIVDLLSLLNESQIQDTPIMVYCTLIIFSWSLFQFSLNLVVTRGRGFQAEEMMEEEEEESDLGTTLKMKCMEKLKCCKIGLLDSEVWSILVTLFFQDGPFFSLRLTAVLKFGVRTFVTMFFTCKNAIIVFLQLYRLASICCENEDQQDAADFETSFTSLRGHDKCDCKCHHKNV